MKVLLIAPSINPITYKGLGRYCKEIYNGLRKLIDADLIIKTVEMDKALSTYTEIPLRILKAGKHDIVHALTPEMGVYTPLLCQNAVTTFHDLIPILESGHMRFKFPHLINMHTRFTWWLSGRAKRIIANSTQTKQELTQVLGIRTEKIGVIPLGVHQRFKPAENPRIHRPPTIGFFGNFTYRKGADAAIETFRQVREKVDVQLTLAGGRIQTPYQRHFNLNKMTEGLKGVKTIEHVPEKDLPKLYQSFDVMLCPSSYEGFGLPILEAQKCGVPVLTMDNARIPLEVKKETVVCKSVKDMANRTIDLLMNDHLRREVSERGRRYASQFTWENTIRKTLEVYNRILLDPN